MKYNENDFKTIERKYQLEQFLEMNTSIDIYIPHNEPCDGVVRMAGSVDLKGSHVDRFAKEMQDLVSRYTEAAAGGFDPIPHQMADLGNRIISINTANGWNVTQPNDWDDDEYKIPAILALITSETSEALEAFRKRDFENFKEECADQIIRILDLCAGLEIDIDYEVSKKLKKNKQRAHKHGGKRI